MKSSCVLFKFESQHLRSLGTALTMLMAISLIPAIVAAQEHSVPADETGQSSDRTRQATCNHPNVQVPSLYNAVPLVGSSETPVREGESQRVAPRAADDPPKDISVGKKEKEKKEKRGEIIVAPIPISSPAIGTGIIPVVGYIFPMDRKDKVTPPSIVGGVGLITNNGSRALALGGNLYLRNGAYQVTSAYLRGNLNYDFYGTGPDAGDAGRKLALKQTGQVFFAEGLRRLGWKFYLGPRGWVGHSQIAKDLSKSDVDHPNIPELFLNTSVKALGVRLFRDTRPNRFYPTSGTLFEFTSNFFKVTPNVITNNGSTGNSDLPRGSSISSQAYRLTFNKYGSLGKAQVLAYNLHVCAVNGDAPFYLQCIFGTSNQLRGYVAGRYIDRRMFATQLEYRVSLPKRFGLAAFGGVGEVAPTVAKFRYDDLLPAIGAGLRYNLSLKYHVNLRLDVAQGKNGGTWSMGVGEAF